MSTKPTSAKLASKHSGSLAIRTLVGFLAAISQTFGGRLAGLVGQFVVAYFLSPENFSSVALTLTVVSITSVLQSSSLMEALINRRKAIRSWEPTAQRLALLLAFIAGLLTLLGTPIAAMVYDDPVILQLGVIFALAQWIQGFSIVPTALLQADLKFVPLAKINLLSSVLGAVTLSLAALAGFGAHSFPISRLASASTLAISTNLLSPPRSKRKARKRAGKYLAIQTSLLMLVGLTGSICLQVDYMMLGLFHNTVEVGYYFFAFSIAGQTANLIGGSVTAVVHPILSVVSGNQTRQSDVTLRMVRAVSAIGYPLTLIQVAGLPIVFHEILPDRWLPSLDMARVLSIGLGANMVCGVCWGLLKVQGKVNWLLWINLAAVLEFSIGCFLAAKYFSPIAVAWLLVAHCVVYTQTLLWMTCKAVDRPGMDGIRLTVLPMATCVGTGLLTHRLTGFGMESELENLASFLMKAGLFSAAYAAVMCLLDRVLLGEIRTLASHFGTR